MTPASVSDIRDWLSVGLDKKATHMLVVCHLADNRDYPIYVLSGENVLDVFRQTESSPILKVREVYNFSLPIEDQLEELRAFHM